MAVYGGKKEIMKNVAPTGRYIRQVLFRNPIATTAGIKTIELLQEDSGLYDRIEANTKKLAAAYRTRAEKLGVAMHINQVGSLMCAFFTDTEVKDYAGAVSSDTKRPTQSILIICWKTAFT